ncbi:MAG: hypothetical protein WCV86_04650 [Patescibacteria group bacterium]|jgi:hypothetical protein
MEYSKHIGLPARFKRVAPLPTGTRIGYAFALAIGFGIAAAALFKNLQPPEAFDSFGGIAVGMLMLFIGFLVFLVTVFVAPVQFKRYTNGTAVLMTLAWDIVIALVLLIVYFGLELLGSSEIRTIQ